MLLITLYYYAGLMGISLVGPSQAALLQQQVVLLDSNAAIVSQLKQLQQTKQKFGTGDPGSALAARFMVRPAAAAAGGCAQAHRGQHHLIVLWCFMWG